MENKAENKLENKLKSIFEYQRFEKNAHLERLIQESMERYESTELSDDDLEFVNAAGVNTHIKPDSHIDNRNT